MDEKNNGKELEIVPNIKQLTSYQGHLISNLVNDINDINKPLQIWSGTKDNFNALTEVNFEKYLYFIV
jgi:hypothetical protein